MKYILYECGICECLHPWDWDGDCRDNDNRFADESEYAEIMGVSVYRIEVRSMEERIEADYVAIFGDEA